MPAILLEIRLDEARLTLVRESGVDVTLRFGDEPRGSLLEAEWRQEIIIDDDRVVIAGRLPQCATSAEAVLPNGQRVACAAGSGVWMVVLPNTGRDRQTHPILFRDGDGEPVAPALPAHWERRSVDRLTACPACGRTAWDVVTPPSQLIGSTRTAPWGYAATGPNRAYVCRVCGHQDMIGAVLGNPSRPHHSG